MPERSHPRVYNVLFLCTTTIAAQVGGALFGAWMAHAMFDLPIFNVSVKGRNGIGQLIAETVATFGLIVTIWGTRPKGSVVTAACVGAYITAAYWFTASTSFANPAVTLARALTPTFAGIAPANVAAFMLAQLAGALLAFAFTRFMRMDRRDPTQA